MQGSYTAGGNIPSSQQDKLVYYASIFVYTPKLKAEFKDYSPSLKAYESNFLFGRFQNRFTDDTYGL
jgi:hypothetical protein